MLAQVWRGFTGGALAQGRQAYHGGPGARSWAAPAPLAELADSSTMQAVVDCDRLRVEAAKQRQGADGRRR
ncbi:hypothetical protein XFF6992_210043 [Xanthomonas citri pv. fuscans]|uniref:Uncharacterized protein n=1 Tax=Xanthomonas campestris pv. phaseoli TaxID=317013 RepID=A0A7Z7IZX9_XANCH|nr:hypothetical protein XFF6990_400041 [Xanthomonas citri pv. fuscans]SOO18067.1 hypothetical protein XFF6992_210043 [Xanthomonas citri pv. fuscans]SOO23303.1 hypothetical protein XFF6991_260009 [Xanthomonas phaseoli pv. phaseoli]SOO31424.1 hypothetical protein XFF6994_1360007 [Xanthomonas citri pv. fuscans]